MEYINLFTLFSEICFSILTFNSNKLLFNSIATPNVGATTSGLYKMPHYLNCANIMLSFSYINISVFLSFISAFVADTQLY